MKGLVEVEDQKCAPHTRGAATVSGLEKTTSGRRTAASGTLMTARVAEYRRKTQRVRQQLSIR